MKVLLLNFFLIIVTFCFSQIKPGSCYKGYILKNDEKIIGSIEYKNKIENQEVVVFIPENQKTKETYKATQIQGYSFEGVNYVSISISDKKSVFVIQNQKMPLQIFNLYSLNEELGVHEHGRTRTITENDEEYLSVEPILVKEGVKVRYVSRMLNFAKQMTDFTNDYAELTKKILDKLDGYKIDNVNQIVAEYNLWKLKNN